MQNRAIPDPNNSSCVLPVVWCKFSFSFSISFSISSSGCFLIFGVVVVRVCLFHAPSSMKFPSLQTPISKDPMRCRLRFFFLTPVNANVSFPLAMLFPCLVLQNHLHLTPQFIYHLQHPEPALPIFQSHKSVHFMVVSQTRTHQRPSAPPQPHPPIPPPSPSTPCSPPSTIPP